MEASAAVATTREGEVLDGKYRLMGMLGAGGQGDVYRAINEMTGREVAIKLLRAELASDPTTVARFLREARAATLVRHPNVVDILDVGTHTDGSPFIVQELLEGVSLDEYLQDRRGSLYVSDALEILTPIVDAVGAAHQRGVVHRDLKPGNVFLVRTPGGLVPKVLDFGLSKMTLTEGEVDVTTTGTWVGSPGYMAPEQIRSLRLVDARSDVWSLGVILYEMLAGRRPFVSQTMGDLFVLICTEDPQPLCEVAPRVPEELMRVQQRCMQRDPAERYASAKELANDLEVFRRGDAVAETMSAASAGAVPVPDLVTPRARVPARTPSASGGTTLDRRAKVTSAQGNATPDAAVSVAMGEAPKRGAGRTVALALGALVVIGGAMVFAYGIERTNNAVRMTRSTATDWLTRANAMSPSLPSSPRARPVTVPPDHGASVPRVAPVTAPVPLAAPTVPTTPLPASVVSGTPLHDDHRRPVVTPTPTSPTPAGRPMLGATRYE